jgi:5'-methylthioadenosine phosphorylase
MARLALIGGHSILGSEPLLGLRRIAVGTPYGKVTVLEGERHVLIQRHGLDEYRTAAKIDHRANIAAIERLGCDRIVAVGSVGSLHERHPTGTFLCPDDFIATQLGISFSEGHGGEQVPAFDATWRERILSAWGRRMDVPLLDGGTYWQAIGPRFETPAEIRMIAPHADVIGMTIASECVLAGELGIVYAAVCVVDNLANGVGGAPLAVEDFEAGKSLNRTRLLSGLGVLVEELAGAPVR